MTVALYGSLEHALSYDPTKNYEKNISQSTNCHKKEHIHLHDNSMLLLSKCNKTALTSQRDAAIQIYKVTAAEKWKTCSLLPILFFAPTILRVQMLQLTKAEKLKPAAFTILANSDGSKKFLISSRAGAGREGHKVKSRGN